MGSKLNIIFAASLVCAAATSTALCQEDPLVVQGRDGLEVLQEQYVVLEFNVRSPMTVGFRGEIGWALVRKPGATELYRTVNFVRDGTARMRVEPGVYDVYVGSNDTVRREKFVRKIDVRGYRFGDIITTILNVPAGWDGQSAASNSARTVEPPAPAAPAPSSSADSPDRGAGRRTGQAVEAAREAERQAQRRGEQAVADAREAEALARKRAAETAEARRETERIAQMRIAEASSLGPEEAQATRRRAQRAIEDARDVEQLAQRKLAAASEAVAEAERLAKRRSPDAADALRDSEQSAAQAGGWTRQQRPAARARDTEAASVPAPARVAPAPPSSGGARGKFTLKIYEAARFADGAILKSDDRSADVSFFYQVRSNGMFVYLGAEKIKELGASPARFSRADAAGWDDAIFGPAPGYYGVVSKGKRYLVHVESYENQGKAASYWKLNCTWEALD